MSGSKHWCDPCKGDGLQVEVFGYCTICQEFCCTKCWSAHLGFSCKSPASKAIQHSTSAQQGDGPAASQQNVPASAAIQQGRDAGETHAQRVMDINVSSSDDSHKPQITGCVVLSSNKLVAVNNNNTVKLVDLALNKVASKLKLPGGIWDIAKISSTQVAVTSPRTIFIVNVGELLKLDREIDVKCRCQGIASINDKLVVSYEKPAMVEIISMSGIVLQTVVTEDQGRELFTEPGHIAVSTDQQTIYISDEDRDTITSVDLTGKVKATYKSDKLGRPSGLTVDSSGSVYVCGGWSDIILQLTADLTEKQQLPQEPESVVGPNSLYYCDTTGRLYVGTLNNHVEVYQLN